MDNHKLIRALQNGLTVEEMIEELQTMDPKSKVVFAYNYGDYSKTQVAAVVTSIDCDVEVEWSEYCRMPKIVLDDGGNCEDADIREPIEENMVVVINLDTTT